MDNSDVLGEGDVAQMLSAAGFVLSASITDKSMLAGIEPLYDILSGNPAALTVGHLASYHLLLCQVLVS